MARTPFYLPPDYPYVFQPYQVGKTYRVHVRGNIFQARLKAIAIPMDDDAPASGWFSILLLFEEDGKHIWQWTGRAALQPDEVQALKSGKVAFLQRVQKVAATRPGILPVHHW